MLRKLIVSQTVKLIEPEGFMARLIERETNTCIITIVNQRFEDFVKSVNTYRENPLARLLDAVGRGFLVEIDKIVIYDFKEGIFKVRADLQDKQNRKSSFELKVEEMMLLNLVYEIDIYTNDHVIKEVGIDNREYENIDEREKEIQKSEIEQQEQSNQISILDQYSTQELMMILSNAMEMKDYKAVALIRKEIHKRRNS